MTRITPYIRYDGRCNEALGFYKECLGGELAITKVSETPMSKQMPPQMQDRVMHGVLSKGGVALILGSDMIGPEGLHTGNSFVLQVECDSENELRTLYTKLASNGGNATYPPAPSFWGGVYGQVTDKFGIGWMLNFQKQAR